MTNLHAWMEFLNQPFFVLLIAAIFILVVLRTQKIDLPTFIVAINSISSQPFALLVLGMGFWMLLECKKWSIDTTIAGGVIGVASNMLQSQIKDAAGQPLHVVPSGPSQPPVATLVPDAAPRAATPTDGQKFPLAPPK